MTCNQAKEISIVEFLKNYDFHPVHIRGNDFWYLSPLRDEKTPSFKVNDARNVFYDHGEGKGGNLIDLGCTLFKCNVKELLSRLDGNSFFFHQQLYPKNRERIVNTVDGSREDPKIIVNHIKSLGNNPAICDYLNSRGISVSVAIPFCKEVYYQLGGRNYFAVGFENSSGGYELRSAFFKGSSSPKDVTHFDNGSKSVCVLEGFMDFLSLLSLRQHTPVKTDFLILNSVSFAARSLPLVRKYENVFLYLDQDKAGRKTAELYKSEGINPVDVSGFYRQYKDLNEYLISGQRPERELKETRTFKKGRGLGL